MILGDIQINCDACPYVDVEELYERLEFSDKEEAIMNCWCEKTGGKLLYYGTCDDAIRNVPPPLYRDKKAVRQKRERDKKHKDRLKRLYKDINGEYIREFYPVYPVNKNGDYEDNENDVAYYKRAYIDHSYSKKRSNRLIRKYQGKIPSGCSYKKIHDLWWDI